MVCFADINGEQVARVAEANRARRSEQAPGVTWAEVDVTRRNQVRP
jgi:meso-butanediol dehydrogenase/(S,S)-butanediol dehydrogenase/diacetyl reductase